MEQVNCQGETIALTVMDQDNLLNQPATGNTKTTTDLKTMIEITINQMQHTKNIKFALMFVGIAFFIIAAVIKSPHLNIAGHIYIAASILYYRK